MKTNKSLKEAILRAPESTNENKQQQQEQLIHPDTTPVKSGAKQRDPINEKPRNVIESLHTLRELEYEVEKKKKKI
jgi:hypothetical protein